MISIPASILAPIDLKERTTKLDEQARDLERLLAREDFDASEDARARIAEGRKHLRRAAGDFEAADEQYRNDEAGPEPDGQRYGDSRIVPMSR